MFHNHPLLEVSDFVAREAQQSKVAVIFDLDSTLFCVSPRTEAILRRLRTDPALAELYPERVDLLAQVEILPTDWGIEDIFSRHGIPTGDAFQQAVFEAWAKHFFSSDYLYADKIYPSANEYVRHLHGMGADIFYLTGRPEGAMRAGTLAALSAWGFPLDESRLFMKPHELESDEGFKSQVLTKLAGTYPHLWFFENEPVIISQVRKNLPHVHIVFVNSVHSGRAEAPTDLRSIGMDFRPGLKG